MITVRTEGDGACAHDKKKFLQSGTVRKIVPSCLLT